MDVSRRIRRETSEAMTVFTLRVYRHLSSVNIHGESRWRDAARLCLVAGGDANYVRVSGRRETFRASREMISGSVGSGLWKKT